MKEIAQKRNIAATATMFSASYVPIASAKVFSITACALTLMAAGASQAQTAVTDGVYRLVAVHSGQALEVYYAETQDGALVAQHPFAGYGYVELKPDALVG